jgi:hypothetical protein
LEKLADCVHEPVLYILLKQNRELQYASELRASRADKILIMFVLVQENCHVTEIELAT